MISPEPLVFMIASLPDLMTYIASEGSPSLNSISPFFRFFGPLKVLPHHDEFGVNYTFIIRHSLEISKCVPVAATTLQGLDSLLSIVQMPKGVPVGTMAIGAAGAANAGLLAVGMLAAAGDVELREKLMAWRAARRDEVLAQGLEDLDVPTTKAGV